MGDWRRADRRPAPTMKDSRLPNRRSIRWRGYDYSSRGIYFVTICAFERRTIFGSICSGALVPSLAGRIASEIWFDLPNRHVGLNLDAFVVMPNHVHGILLLCSPKPDSTRKTAGPETVVGAGLRPAPTTQTCRKLFGRSKHFRP